MSAQGGRWRNSSVAGLTKLRSLAVLAVLSPKEGRNHAAIFSDSGCQKLVSEGTSGASRQSRKPKQLHTRSLTELIGDCKGFIDSAEKRLVKLEAERALETALLEEGRACFASGRSRLVFDAAWSTFFENWEQRCREELASERSLKHQCRACARIRG